MLGDRPGQHSVSSVVYHGGWYFWQWWFTSIGPKVFWGLADWGKHEDITILQYEKWFLYCYESWSSLRINFHKSSVINLGTRSNIRAAIATTLNCLDEPCLLRYLGSKIVWSTSVHMVSWRRRHTCKRKSLKTQLPHRWSSCPLQCSDQQSRLLTTCPSLALIAGSFGTLYVTALPFHRPLFDWRTLDLLEKKSRQTLWQEFLGPLCSRRAMVHMAKQELSVFWMAGTRHYTTYSWDSHPHLSLGRCWFG